MNWHTFGAQAKYILKNRNRVNLLNTLRAQNKNLENGFIYLNKNTALTLTPEAMLRVKEGAYFYFNEYWHQKDNFPGMLGIFNKALLEVRGKFTVYSGARLVVNDNARLILGSGYINHGLNLNCFASIEIGHDVAISENVTIRDSDNHQILAKSYQSPLPIKIGNHVWIGMNVTILKGVTSGDGAVIAAGAVVNKNVPARCLVGGVPARILKENIDWQ